MISVVVVVVVVVSTFGFSPVARSGTAGRNLKQTVRETSLIVIS